MQTTWAPEQGEPTLSRTWSKKEFEGTVEKERFGRSLEKAQQWPRWPCAPAWDRVSPRAKEAG